MAQYKVEICGVNTGKLTLLTEEEKQILFDKIKTGDRNARDTFILGNLRLVLSIIQRFTNTGENVDDLFQIGARIGGDEFEVILRNVDEDAAKHWVYTFEQSLENYNKKSGKPYEVHASTGYMKIY